MPEVEKIWKKFLTSIITNTFNEFISTTEIENRVDWIISKMIKVNPNKLFKNLLYMMNNNALSQMAIGYKLHFILDDYQALFMEPYTEEFDRNEFLSAEDSKIIPELIENFSLAINHHIELMIYGKNENHEDLDLINIVKELSQHYSFPSYQILESKIIQDGDFVYKMDFGQILYMVAFNQNPFTGNPCDPNVAKSIREHYYHRLLAMETLKKSWPSGIPLKYVKSGNIF